MKKLMTISTLIPVMLLTGCSQIPSYEKPKTELPSESSWQQLNKPQVSMQLDINENNWWQQLSNDKVLVGLIDEALQHNSDVGLAKLNLRQARSVLQQNQSALYPELGINGELARTQSSDEVYPLGNQATFSQFSLGALLSYELDIWGKNSALVEQAQANLNATEADQKAIKLSVTSAVAQSYLNLMAINQNIQIARNTVKSRNEALALRNAQFEYGSATPLSVHQAESELASVEISLQQLLEQRQLQLHALAVLIGRSPQALVEQNAQQWETQELNSLNSLPLPKLVPSELLERRPDIVAVEQRLIAANASIGVAKAALFPSISLTGLLGFQSEALDRLFVDEAEMWNASAAINAPIFDYGKRQSQVQITQAQKEALVIQYQQTIRTAFKEVLDALTQLEGSNIQLAAQQRQVKALRQILSLSEQRYGAGYSSYLEVLDAQRNLFTAELAEVSMKLNHASALVNLYKALGGQWQKEPTK